MTIIRSFLKENIDAVQALAHASRVYVPNGSEDLLLTAWQGDALQGFAAWQSVLDEATLLGIAVAMEARRQGIAGRLMRESEQYLAQARMFFLEVRAGNDAAQALYRAHGYVEIARRKGYYGDEDALVLQKARS